jgi:hypothetical protein
MAPTVQQPYNLFALQKQAGYPGSVQTQQPQQVQQPQQNIVPGQVVGETPEQFAAGKQAANSQAGAVSQPVVQHPQPVVQQTPARKTQGTVQNKPAITNMDELAAAMGYTSPEQEDKLRKASVANQRMLAVVDALRHIGNIAHTVNYAPSQQFNQPWAEENARYLQGKALRDKANQTYISYQQAKAAQDAKQRQWEQEHGYKEGMLRHYQDQDRRLWERDAATALYHEGILGLRKEKQKLDDDYRNKRISIDEYNARSRRISALASQARAAGSGGSGGRSNMPDYEVVTENTLNDDGRIVSQRKTRTVKRDGKTTTSTKTTKKTLPGQTSSTSTTEKGKKRLPGT